MIQYFSVFLWKSHVTSNCTILFSYHSHLNPLIIIYQEGIQVGNQIAKDLSTPSYEKRWFKLKRKWKKLMMEDESKLKQVPGSRGWRVRFCFDFTPVAGATQILMGTWWVVYVSAPASSEGTCYVMLCAACVVVCLARPYICAAMWCFVMQCVWQGHWNMRRNVIVMGCNLSHIEMGCGCTWALVTVVQLLCDLCNMSY